MRAPESLKGADRLGWIAGFHGPNLPPGVAQELIDLAYEWNAKSDSLRMEIDAKVAAYREIKALEDGIREAIAFCDRDARDQDHNATLTGWGRCSRAYAVGRGTACKGIAAHLTPLLLAASS